jgi:hypothetical protein
MYFKAVNDLDFQGTNFGSEMTQVSASLNTNTKLGKLIHYRRDVGFAGITEFHCRAIMGACWDQKAAQYSATYNIPQCYEEQKIELTGTTLQLYDPKLFKPVVPKQFQAAEGECDTNYFHISTLYYKRRACTYSIDMIKYGSEFNPLNEPSRQDCLFRLGCCYEDNDEVMQQYPFMPKCYHRVKNDVIDGRLHDMKLVYNTPDWHKSTNAEYNAARVCGATAIDTFLGTTFQTRTGITKTAILAYYDAADGSIAGEEHLAIENKHTQVVSGSLMSMINTNDEICLYMRNDWFSTITSAGDFWKAFDVFDKQYIIEEQVPQANIPESLRGLMADLF